MGVYLKGFTSALKNYFYIVAIYNKPTEIRDHEYLKKCKKNTL